MSDVFPLSGISGVPFPSSCQSALSLILVPSLFPSSPFSAIGPFSCLLSSLFSSENRPLCYYFRCVCVFSPEERPVCFHFRGGGGVCVCVSSEERPVCFHFRCVCVFVFSSEERPVCFYFWCMCVCVCARARARTCVRVLSPGSFNCD